MYLKRLKECHPPETNKEGIRREWSGGEGGLSDHESSVVRVYMYFFLDDYFPKVPRVGG